MKKQNKHLVKLILAVLLWSVVIPMWGQDESAAGYITVSGVVKINRAGKTWSMSMYQCLAVISER